MTEQGWPLLASEASIHQHSTEVLGSPKYLLEGGKDCLEEVAGVKALNAPGPQVQVKVEKSQAKHFLWVSICILLPGVSDEKNPGQFRVYL